MIRLATHNDIEAVTAIYEHIHMMEADGLVRIGWNPSTQYGRRQKRLCKGATSSSMSRREQLWHRPSSTGHKFPFMRQDNGLSLRLTMR